VKLMVLAETKLGEQSAIYEDRKSGIITIVVADRNPQRAAGLARAYVEELDRLVSQLSTSSAHRERVFLEERLKTVKQDLDLASEQFGQFASKNTAIDIQAQGKAMVEAAAGLQGKLIAAQSELQMLRQIYTNENVRVRATQAQIGELQKELEKMGQGEPNKKLTNTAEAADPLYPSIRDLPLLGITYTDLLRRAKIEETVYEVLTQQYELAKVEEAKETPTVKVLDPAEVPEKKSFPARMAILAYGTLLSLGAVAIWILARAHWERTNPQDPRKAFAAEIFRTVQAEMPWAANGAGSGGRMQRIWRRWGRKAGPRAGTE
jgi:capsule polysaccharide export protein KpsE/RkpR